MFRHIIVLLAGLVLGPALAHADMQRGSYLIVDKLNLHYGSFGQNIFDACIPLPKPGQWAGPFPAVIFIHGGAWGGGDKSYHKYDCNIWASYGFVGININYRLLSSRDQTTWWPAQIIDAQAAVRFIRANAASFNLAPDHVYALGDSAGGQIAEYLAYDVNVVAGDLSNQNTRFGSKIQGVVAEFAPSHWGPSLVRSEAPDPRTYNLVVADHAHTAATLLVQGTLDTIVAPGNSTDLYYLLKGYGRSVEYLSFVGKHEFVGMAPAEFEAIRAREITFMMGHAKYFGAMPRALKGPVLP